MTARMIYTQLCYTVFEDGNLCNGYITTNVNVDADGKLIQAVQDSIILYYGYTMAIEKVLFMIQWTTMHTD
jgi:hypothetical protein